MFFKLKWIHGIFIGNKIAMNLHIRKLEIESDSAIVVSLFHFESYEFHHLATLINNYCTLMRCFDYCTVTHVPSQ